MKKALIAAAAFVALPAIAQAQTPMPGFYIGAEGGLNWMLNFNANTPVAAAPVVGVTPGTGWMAGGVIGYFVVGPWEDLFPYLLVAASSSFIYVAVADLLPQMQRYFSLVQRAGKRRSPALQAFVDACRAMAAPSTD
mgnify:CR=1 FL=1